MEVALMAREAYATSRNPLFGSQGQTLAKRRAELLRNFQRLAQLNGTPAGFRRLALLQHALKQPDWRVTIAKIRTLPAVESFAAEEELAKWDELLGDSKLPASQSGEMEKWIASMELGWYGHLAREALYKKTGQAARAEQAAAAAESPWNRMMLLVLGAAFLMLCGVGLGALVVVFLVWSHKNPTSPRPFALQFHPPTPLSSRQGETLYMVFLIYLVSHAVMQLGIGRLLGALLANRARDMPDYALQGLAVGLALVWIAIPLFALIRLAPRVGLTSADIGLRSRNLLIDVLWGIGGWMAALPIVLVVTLIAAFVFRGVDSPSHPAIMELASSRNVLTILLLMFQASILAPVTEELMFRGVFFRSLSARMRWIPALIITSSVFAILHPQLPLGFFALFTLGAMFNALYALRGSLVPAITAHALNNTAVLVGVLLVFGN
jgi:membrane protease YdiL (CAAX protease family)